ncbi:MAG: TonB family protein [Bacteroidaceae bacterium]|nr:TonB family protein [Bacteroidaceae bacterium]
MKKIFFFAGIILLCNSVTAREISADTPSDSIKTRMEIKKMDFKSVENKPLEKPLRKEIKSIDKELKTDIKEDLPPVDNKPFNRGNKSSVQEIKNSAKKSGKAPAKTSSRPAVSHPSYPGGNIAIRDFVRKNQKYPKECKGERLRGRVEVIISIAPDGTPHSATISKSSGNVYMDAEALRVADLMPKWNPAADSDDPQSIDHILFFNFRPGR